MMAENAAMTSAVLRDMQVRWLKGETVTAGEMSSTENTFNRTAQALGLKRRSKDITPDLAKIIEQKAAEKAEAEAAASMAPE